MKELVTICLSQGFLSESQAAEVISIQRITKRPAEDILRESGLLTDEQLATAFGSQLQLPVCRVRDIAPDEALIGLLTPKQAEKARAIPIQFDHGRLTLVTDQPLKLDQFDQLRQALGYRLKLAVTTQSELTEALEKYYGASLQSVSTVLEDFKETDLSQYYTLLDNEASTIAPESLVNEAPIIRLVNTIISGAVSAGASDIHLEPFEDQIVLRYRIDGVLQETAPPPKSLYPAVASRIKLMAGMDITERRIPQDGRIKVKTAERVIDIRAAVVPTLYGEEIVMRILNRESMLLGLEQLGFSAANLHKFQKVIREPHGMILVTGPTGSGKTTTLYAALQILNEPGRKIITIEDPVEYQLKGVNQIQVNPKVNFSFAQGLRTVVRHDPDVILVGEIRDRETAEVAIQSALTGHLVFATLHTNDAPSAFTRLIDMGVEGFLVASTVQAVLAQRLVRRICPHCRTAYQPTATELDILRQDGVVQLMHGVGCDECNMIGYRGQIGVFEFLTSNEEIERLVMRRSNTGKIRDAAIKNGMLPLRADGLRKVDEGLTTLAEVVRVTRE
jgi:type II secretion system protein E